MKKKGKDDARRLAIKEAIKRFEAANPFSLERIKEIEKLEEVSQNEGGGALDAGQPNNQPDAGHRPFEGKYSELVPEIILRILERCVVQPFGCEFTFIRADGKVGSLPGFNCSHRFHEDDGALEHPSKVFKSIEECFDFWLDLCAELRPLGFLPQRGRAPNGGLHINIDFPSQDRKKKASHVKQLFRVYNQYERYLRLLNEPGDYHNAQFFQLHYRQVQALSDNVWLKFLYNAPSKLQCFAYHGKYLEFRHFNSPASLAELAIYVLHAQSMMQPSGPQPVFSSWLGLKNCDFVSSDEHDDLMTAFNVVLNKQLGWHYAEDRAVRDCLDYEVVRSTYKFS